MPSTTRVDAARPETERCHVSLYEPGRGDEPVSAAELDGREVHAEHLHPVAGQLTGCRYPRSAAQIHDPGTGWQPSSQFPRPARITADVLGGGSRRRAVVAAVCQRDGVVAAADKVTLACPLGHTIRIRH